MNRMLAAFLLAVVATLATAAPALAHPELIASTPTEGATLSAAPRQVQLTFNEPIQAQLSTVTVTGPDGAHWGTGQPTLANTALTVPVRPTGPAGHYTLGYRVLGADGHPVAGTVRFTLTNRAGPATAAPQPSSDAAQPPAQPAATTTVTDGGGVPAWVWIVGIVVLLGAGLALAVRIGRSSGT